MRSQKEDLVFQVALPGKLVHKKESRGKNTIIVTRRRRRDEYKQMFSSLLELSCVMNIVLLYIDTIIIYCTTVLLYL